MYCVNLSHRKNPDIPGGYWEVPTESGKAKPAKCASLQAAAQQCLEYIQRNNLGSGNWTGGAVFIHDAGSAIHGRVQVATISYNGRIWDMNNKPIP